MKKTSKKTTPSSSNSLVRTIESALRRVVHSQENESDNEVLDAVVEILMRGLKKAKG